MGSYQINCSERTSELRTLSCHQDDILPFSCYLTFCIQIKKSFTKTQNEQCTVGAGVNSTNNTSGKATSIIKDSLCWYLHLKCQCITDSTEVCAQNTALY